VSNDTLDTDAKVPAALNLPFGQLFFGFNVVTYTPPSPPSSPAGTDQHSSPFSGTGNTLSGRSNPSVSTSTSKGKEKERATSDHTWGSGLSLGGPQGGPVGVGRARVPQPPQRGDRKQRSPSPEEEEEEDWGVDDDDVIMIDSD